MREVAAGDGERGGGGGGQLAVYRRMAFLCAPGREGIQMNDLPLRTLSS